MDTATSLGSQHKKGQKAGFYVCSCSPEPSTNTAAWVPLFNEVSKKRHK